MITRSVGVRRFAQVAARRTRKGGYGKATHGKAAHRLVICYAKPSRLSLNRSVQHSMIRIQSKETLKVCGTEVSTTGVYQIQPIQDPRWVELVDRHPRSSVFHTVAWLEALTRTYGFQPIAYTTSPPGCSLGNGLVLCRVESWITGGRLISLPFSDHCEPLLNDAKAEDVIISALEQALHR